jgi:YD repeat-containing protein
VEQGALAAWQSESVPPSAWAGFAVHKAIGTDYDALDRKTRVIVVGEGGIHSATEYSYDLHGRVRCTAVRMNPDAWLTPLPDKCVPGPVHPANGADRISKNVYDAAGQLIEVWDGVGTPLQRREALYTYNGNGQKLSLTDARGFKAEMR